jgi:uncharacterized membrane protein (UPF0182 family)
VYVEPLSIAPEKGQLPELKRVIVALGTESRWRSPSTDAIARVFGGPPPRAGADIAPRPPVGTEGSVKTLLDAAASAVTRANEELRHLDELLRRLRDAGGR